MKTRGSIRARIRAGAAFLDSFFGSRSRWRRKIDLETLALENGEACVLGQVDGDFHNHEESFGLTDIACDALGFSTTYRKYPELTKEWKAYLRGGWA